MKIHPTPIAGVVLAETTPYIDHRGSFARLFCERELAPVLGERRIVQINHSRTAAIWCHSRSSLSAPTPCRDENGALP
jgi:dTDP-4-dehydrorhamnose 3,5-epimerase